MGCAAIPARIFGLLGVSFAVSMAEETPTLPDLLVEAVRDSVVPPHFSGSATIIDEKEISESGSRSVADLLITRGGVRITSSSGNTSDGEIHLRGFGENSASRVLILVDGKALNRADMGTASLLEIPISQLAGVEVLRGAQTATFGDHAVGGVINLMTKQAVDEGAGNLEMAGGSDDLFLLRAGYSKRINGHGFRFNLERNDTAGWRDHAASELDAASVQWDKDLSPNVNLTSGFSWSESYAEFPGPVSEDEFRSRPRHSIYGDSGYGDQYFSEQKTYRWDSSLLIRPPEGADLEIPLGWTHRDLSWNFGPGSHSDNRMNTVSLVPQFKFGDQKWSAAAGLNLRYDSIDLVQFAELSRRNRVGDAKLERWVAGVFSSIHWEPLQDWHWNFGGRWENSGVKAAAANRRSPNDSALNYSQSNDDGNFAIQIGTRWDLREAVSTWLRYDRLYRLPSTDEIASYQGFPLSEPFNANLSAETGHNLELGMEYTPGNWTWRLNGFSQWLEGEIAYDYLRNLNVNFADTRRIGLEASASYRGRNWDAALNYTWLKAEYASGEYRGNEVYLVPNHELSAILGWQIREDWRVQTEYQFVGGSFEGNDFSNDQSRLPTYQLFNLLIDYSPKSGLSIYARVNNLLDERYATIKYSGLWYPGAGRQFLVGIRKTF